jgi:hypothetical protein
MYRIGLWCCCLMWCLSLSVKAAEHLSDHEVFCRQEPATACLDLIQQGLAQAEPFSLQLLAQMDASLLEANYRDDFSLLQQQLESDFPLCAAD